MSSFKSACGNARTKSIAFDPNLLIFNCQYQTDADNMYYKRICLPIAIAPFLHTALCTEAGLMFEDLAVWFTFSFKGPDYFDWSCFVGKSVAVDD